MSEPASKHVPPLQRRAPGQAPGHRTALHRAAAAGNSHAVAALVQGGCALDLQARDGNTALHDVSWHGFHRCVKLLVTAGADVHVKNQAGNTALHLACQNAHARSARVLLLGGSAADDKNDMGDTCLHVASRYNNLNVLKILLSALCSVTETNKEGDTALHTAAALNHKRTVRLLLHAGADGNLRNNAGRTALDVARDHNNKEAVEVLARAPQVLHYMRGRRMTKRRERLKADRRTQSVPSVDMLATKESVSPAADSRPDGEPGDTRAAVLPTGRRRCRHQRRELAAAADGSPQGRRGGAKAVNEDHAGRGEVDPSKTQRRKGRLLSRDTTKPRRAGAYLLYTLYRDRDGVVRQAPASGSHCRPRLRKLEAQIQATQEEMRTHIVAFQDHVNVQLERMRRRNRRQMEVMDMVNQQRAATEREEILSRMEQRAERAREEALRSQAATSRDLKRWCVSQMRDMDLPLAPETYTLLPSPSVERSQAESDLLEPTHPLLALLPGDDSSSSSSSSSRSSLATYVCGFPSLPSSTSSSTSSTSCSSSSSSSSAAASASTRANEDHHRHQTPENVYLEIKVERPPGGENAALLPADRGSGLPLRSTDPWWRPPGVRPRGSAAPPAAVGSGSDRGSSPGGGGGSRLVGPVEGRDAGDPRENRGQRPGRGRGRTTRERRLSEPLPGRGAVGTAGSTAGSTGATLQFFSDRPLRPTFSQERCNRQAVEVTRRFFEAVSTQLELWYRRKAQEARQQAEERTQQDTEQLLQRISALEEELKRLTANGKT